MNNFKTKLIIWLSLVIICSIILYGNKNKLFSLDTNILHLLPNEQDPKIFSATQKLYAKSDKRVVFALGNQEIQNARDSQVLFLKKARDSDLFELTESTESNQIEKLYQDLLPYKSQLLSQKTKEKLKAELPLKNLLNHSLSKILNEKIPLINHYINEDPLLNIFEFLMSLRPNNKIPTFYEGQTYFYHQNKYYSVLTLELKKSSFDSNNQNTFMQFKQDFLKQANQQFNDFEFISSGVIHYNHYFRLQAQKEINTIGLISILFIIAIFIFIFKSFKYFILAGISIGFGLFLGLTLTAAIFDEIHVLTFVFGTSIIGVSIDYCFHYFSFRFQETNNQSPGTILKQILPSVLLGALTSIMAYFTFYFTFIPAVQQMAVFATFGIIGTLISIWMFLPFFTQNETNIPNMKIFKLNSIKKINKLKFKIKKPMAVLILLLPISLLFIEYSDNLKDIQKLPSAQLNQDLKIKEITSMNLPTEFILIEANSLEENLVLEESLKVDFEKVEHINAITCLSNYLPSHKMQDYNSNLLQSTFNETNFKSISNHPLSNQINIEKSYLPLKGYFSIDKISTSSLIKEILNLHWVKNDKHYSIMLLDHNGSIQTINEIANNHPGCLYHNNLNALTSTLATLRKVGIWFLFVAHLLIMLTMIIKYGLKNGFWVAYTPLSSTFFVTLIFAIIGMKISIGHILGFIVLIGIGVDYTIFLAESKSHFKATVIAIILSGLTTILSFGTLAMSTTSLLNHFGLTILIGITYCLFTSILMMQENKTIQKETP